VSRADQDVTWLFDQDPLTKSRELFHYDATKQQVIIEHIQNVDSILEANARQRAAEIDGRDREFRQVGRIGLGMWQAMRDEWRKLGLSWEERQQRMKDFLNDPAYANFRTDPNRMRI
jgi:hypothetical protein